MIQYCLSPFHSRCTKPTFAKKILHIIESWYLLDCLSPVSDFLCSSVSVFSSCICYSFSLSASTCFPVCHTPWWMLYNTLDCNVAIIFHHRVWYRALSLSNVCIWSSGIILIPQATFVPNFVSFTISIVELAHAEKLCTQSITQLLAQLMWCPGNRSASERIS